MANDRRRPPPNDRPHWFWPKPESGATADWRDNPIEIQRGALDEGRAAQEILACIASADMKERLATFAEVGCLTRPDSQLHEWRSRSNRVWQPIGCSSPFARTLSPCRG